MIFNSSAPVKREIVDLEDYSTEVATWMSLAWETAKLYIKDSQKKQKKFLTTKPKITGDKVFVFFPSKKTGKSYKFARLFQVPYLVQKFI